MIIRKSVNFLQSTNTLQKGCKEYQPIVLSDVNENVSINNVENKGLLKLILSALYFVFLVLALTVLLV
jgi:hypothetical protein